MAMNFEEAEFDPSYERSAVLDESRELFQRADREDFLIVRWTGGLGGEMAAVCAGLAQAEDNHNHLAGFINSVSTMSRPYYEIYQFCPRAPGRYSLHSIFADGLGANLNPHSAKFDALMRLAIAQASFGLQHTEEFLGILNQKYPKPPAVPTIDALIREDAVMSDWRKHCEWSLSQLILLSTDIELFPPDQK